jgi:hypothetical protein
VGESGNLRITRSSHPLTCCGVSGGYLCYLGRREDSEEVNMMYLGAWVSGFLMCMACFMVAIGIHTTLKGKRFKLRWPFWLKK